MIEAFLQSWPLFHNSYLAGWLIAALLALIGVYVIGREQVFIGAAVSQASTLGIACALWLGSLAPASGGGHGHEEGVLPIAMAVAFSVAAALLTSRGSRQRGESQESTTGWVFLCSASLSILIVSRSPLGMEEIQRLLASSIVGATYGDVAGFALLLAVSLAVVAAARARIILVTQDPLMAESVGLKVTWWNLTLSGWMGLAVGFAIHSAGMLYTFGCLVLPPLMARHLCRETAPIFLVSPLLGLAFSAAGFIVANHLDFPPAQMTVALLCGGVLLSRLLR